MISCLRPPAAEIVGTFMLIMPNSDLRPLMADPSHHPPLLLSLQEVKAEFPVRVVVVAILLRLYTDYVKPNYKLHLGCFHMYKDALNTA